jgi:hypothetical protein
MVTDPVPKILRLRAEYTGSDELRALPLPSDDRFVAAARCIEEALGTEETPPVRKACIAFLSAAAEFYGVSAPQVRVLRARPIRFREGGWGTELFGDYHFEEKLIRVWMRTAVQKSITSFGTFFATLADKHIGFRHNLSSPIICDHLPMPAVCIPARSPPAIGRGTSPRTRPRHDVVGIRSIPRSPDDIGPASRPCRQNRRRNRRRRRGRGSDGHETGSPSHRSGITHRS